MLAHLTGAGGLFDGLVHPIVGLDHLIAITAVGALAYLLRAKLAWWSLPTAFVGSMAVGGALAIAGVTVGHTELFVALSVTMLGLVLVAGVGALDHRALSVGVAVIALFHGLAHGGEVPGSAAPALYVSGFVVMTGVLHLSGAAFGLLLGRSRVVRGLVGAGVALTGVALATGV